jgi:hypothetical protein
VAAQIHADRGYDHGTYRKQVRAAGIAPVIARRGLSTVRDWACTDGQSNRASRCRTGFRCLRIRWKIRGDIDEAFLSLACSITCRRRLVNLALC